MTSRHAALRPELERIARPADVRAPARASRLPRRHAARLAVLRLPRRALGRAA